MADRIWISATGAEVPTWLLNQKQIGAQAKLVFGRLVTLARAQGAALCSANDLAEDTGCSPKEALTALKKLTDEGLIEVEGVAGEAGGSLVVWFLAHAWQNQPGLGRKKLDKYAPVSFDAPATEQPSLGLFAPEGPLVRWKGALSPTDPPSAQIDPFVRFPREELPREVGSLADLEQAWRSMLETLQPSVRAAAWGGKERRLIATLRTTYTFGELTSMFSYLQTCWGGIRVRRKIALTLPTLGWLHGNHERTHAEAQSYLPHAEALEAWTRWSTEHSEELFATPPPGLQENAAKARDALAQLGIG